MEHIYIENNDISHVSGNGMARMCLMRWSECQKCHLAQLLVTGGSGGPEEGGMTDAEPAHCGKHVRHLQVPFTKRDHAVPGLTKIRSWNKVIGVLISSFHFC